MDGGAVGNDYDKAFQVTAAGATHTFDSFECANPCAGANLRALRLPDHRPRRGSRRPHVLLRQLC
jgi:hypothetical protein